MIGPRKRWTTAEFDRLLAEGFLVEGSSTYLWDGEIIEPMPQNPPHVNAVANLQRRLIARFPEEEWTINQDAPLELAEGYKPQPDIMVLKGPRSAYRRRTPTPADVALLIEVADSTYTPDARVFLRKYAESRIPQYWIVNIPEQKVEVYSDPSATEDGTPCYLVRNDFGLKESVPLKLTRDGVSAEFGPIPVLDILRDSVEPSAEGVGP
jgi:Uma2 family endonuclease